MEIFERLESNVRSYCRAFPVVFDKAQGPFMYDVNGKRYIDFFCGAGTMNYGHNNLRMKQAVIEYLQNDGVMHSLDMFTVAKQRYLERLESIILQPRKMDYKAQFVAPSGANAVEAALKLARLATGRSNIVAFTNGYHGLSAGALAVTGNSFYRREEYAYRNDVAFMPFDGYMGPGVDTLDYFERKLDDPGSGLGLPAAAVVETIQAEGGVRVASHEWLRRLESICRQHEVLLIVDDVQVGNGRAGHYFSFEPAGIQPDMVAFSKAVSGFGLPMAMLFIRPQLDLWKPGEHTGTFRGNNLAFVSGAEALLYWQDDDFSESIQKIGALLQSLLASTKTAYQDFGFELRGCGMIYGLDLKDAELARALARRAFDEGVMIELCGAKGTVVKFLPCLTIEEDVLREGVSIIQACLTALLDEERFAHLRQSRAKVV